MLLKKLRNFDQKKIDFINEAKPYKYKSTDNTKYKDKYNNTYLLELFS